MKQVELLGKTMEDKVTGFQGTAVCVIFYLYGCAQFGLRPRVNDKNELPKIEYFDEGRLKVIGPGVTVEEVSVDEGGAENNPDCPII